MRKTQPIVLVLGGGGARGFAHYGVLKVLDREKVGISHIVGTSMGAIIGALYAQTANIQKVEEKIRQLLNCDLFKKHNKPDSDNKKSGTWIENIADQICEQLQEDKPGESHTESTSKEMLAILELLLDDMSIKECKIPFAAVATDIIMGTDIILNKGSIIKSVLASSAMPGVISPVKINGHLLSDGAATAAVPIRAAKKLHPYAKIVAVDVSSQLAKSPTLNNILHLVFRVNAITAARYHDELIKEADILIQPQVKDIHWTHFDQADLIIKEGEKAALEHVAKIKSIA